MKIALVQLDIAWEDKDANFARVGRRIARATEDGAELVCLPEMFATGFSMNVAAIAERDGGLTDQWLAQQAREHSIHLLGTRVEWADDTGGSGPSPSGERGRNTAVVYGPDGSRLARYVKNHTISLLDESDHYERGTSVDVFELGGVRTAVLICFDLRFPEAFRRAALVEGAELFLVPANWPTGRAAHWDLLLRARALENLAWVAGINRVGSGGGLEFDGRSQIVSPLGEVVAREADREAIVIAEIDPEASRRARAELGFLDDARSPSPR
jgi:predicted amidohydrolase